MKQLSDEEMVAVLKGLLDTEFSPLKADMLAPVIVRYFSRSEDSIYREMMAEHLNCPPMVLSELANDEEYFVREAVAKHPLTTSQTLEHMLGWMPHDDDILNEIPFYVAQHPNCPEPILHQFAKDEEMWLGLASNPNCPRAILELIAEADDFDDEKLKVAAHPNCPKAILEAFMEDTELRTGVAQNPNCPRHLLERLAKDKNRHTRAEVARNPKTPMELLEQLKEDKDKWVFACVFNNPQMAEARKTRL